MHAPKRADVVGLGQCCLDTIGIITQFPAADRKTEVQNLTTQGGGPVATALVALARWQINCAVMGMVGDDPAGLEIKATLEAEGVDIRGLISRPESRSQTAYIVVEQGTGSRNIFWQRPTGAPLTADEIDVKKVCKAQLLHTDGLFTEASLAAARAARKAGVPVVMDAGTLRNGMLELAASTDFCIASEAFARALTGRDSPGQACQDLGKMGPRLACVTLGDRGYVAWYDNRLIAKPAYPITAVDTTGCGDIFHAGFIYGLLKAWPPEKCLDFGAWAAAHAAQAVGGRAGIPKVEAWPGT